MNPLQAYLRVHAEAATAYRDESLACSRFSRSLRAAVDEALRRSINDVFEEQGILALLTAAPRLVELDASEIQRSRTLAYVQQFITGHDSSAIGLAGFRGAGKSTIMRALTTDTKLANDALLISAPVVYDAADFSQHLLTKVAETIVGENWLELRRAPNRILRLRYAAFIIAIAVGVLLVATDLLPAKLPNLGPLSIVGFSILAYAIAGMYYSALARFLSRGSRPKLSPLQAKAFEILDTLRWEVERNSVTKNVGKLATFGELHDEDSIKRKRRAISRLDSVSYLRDLLRDYASQDHRPRFIICIDELDKISSSESLVDVINNLKDMFHIQGVHFVVSVSIDALRAFERRGLPDRDAFDSSFDSMVNVDNLTLDESVDVLLSRATRFGPRLAGYCHAWSGGLPRDLLRAARRCVEIQQEKGRAVPIADLMACLISHDLLLLVDGLLGTMDGDTVLWTIREILVSGLDQDDIPGYVSRIRASMPTGHDAVNAVITRCCVGLYLLYLARILGPNGGLSENPSNEDINRWFSLLAQASASTSLDIRLQQLALDNCALDNCARDVPLDRPGARVRTSSPKVAVCNQEVARALASVQGWVAWWRRWAAE